MNILQRIFRDHFYTLATSGIHIRDTVFDNVKKMTHCGDSKCGYTRYYCEHCGNSKVVPFRCKSRFCTTCGNLYSIRRSTAMAFKLVNCKHRHCVFTIPEELRIFFRRDRDLLNCLFHAVRDVILRMFFQMNKSECFTPGFICVLHTFGRSLQWNPHIHVLLSEGGCGNKTVWRSVTHFNYTLLRNSFRTALLNHMHKHIGDSFKKTKSYIYIHCPNGFYVYAKPSFANPKQLSKYIGRYLGRPVIATSRIDRYDGQSVTFHFNKHEDNSFISVTLHATDFMKKLIIHIPEKHFKMIRYYGIYTKHHKFSDKLFLALPIEKRRFFASLNTWRTSLLLSFGFDPLLCRCGHTMTVLEIYRKPPSLFEIYRKSLNSS